MIRPTAAGPRPGTEPSAVKAGLTSAPAPSDTTGGSAGNRSPAGPGHLGTGPPEGRAPRRGRKRGPRSKSPAASYVGPTNPFLSGARREGEVGDGVKAQAPKLPRRLLDVLSREEIGQLEDAATTERDKLIVRVLADAGIRVTELTSLRKTDLLERDRRAYLRVQGKGDKQRD